mgnify:CR=1 FL=1
MALLDTLDKADASVGEPYEKMKQIFVELMDSMLKYQDESGMWYQVVNVGGMDRNYLETSGSSIMAYALLKGVRLGFLPESYRTYGEKAFHGICEKYLSEDENGELHLDGICLVAGLGGANRRSGTFDYYMSKHHHARTGTDRFFLFPPVRICPHYIRQKNHAEHRHF